MVELELYASSRLYKRDRTYKNQEYLLKKHTFWKCYFSSILFKINKFFKLYLISKWFTSTAQKFQQYTYNFSGLKDMVC